jgi:hypothetical protein
MHPGNLQRIRTWTTAAFTAALIAGATAQSAAAGDVSADINIHLGSRPAPVVVFQHEPDVILVPRTHVYYVADLDYDLYRYGRYWYINNGGYWYRAASYRGPFVNISVGLIPRSIMVLPAQYRRHPEHPLGGPPGQMKKRVAYYAEDGDRGGEVRMIKRGKVVKDHDRD